MIEERIRLSKNALVGMAVGDAFGVPVEFLSRRQVREIGLRDMEGADSELRLETRWGGGIPKGSWSDDTSMAAASFASFIRNKGKIDYEDQMEQFVQWWDHGKYCCLDYPFGLGGNVAEALHRYRLGTPALQCGGRGFMDNGNGALMRILPFSLYCIFNDLDTDRTAEVAGNGSAVTHGHEISRMCCFAWTEFLRALAGEADVNRAVDYIESIPYGKWFSPDTLDALKRLSGKRVRELTEKDIGETGYVVDTLYAALWSIYHAENFETAIRNAVNLGYDTDTNAAVAGMAAGILYGMEGIPKRWLECLKRREWLESLAADFAREVMQA